MATMSPAATTATTTTAALSYVELCALSCVAAAVAFAAAVAAAAEVCLTFRILMYVAQLQLFKCLTHTYTHMHYLHPYPLLAPLCHLLQAVENIYASQASSIYELSNILNAIPMILIL